MYTESTRIDLYANCNPLSKNCFICVESSRNFGCTVHTYRTTVLPESIKKLKALGYECYTVNVTENHSAKL